MGLQPPHSRRSNAAARPVLGAASRARNVTPPLKIKINARSPEDKPDAMEKLGAEIIALAEACGTSRPGNTDPAELLVAIEEDTEIPVNALAAVAEIINYLCDCDQTKSDTGVSRAKSECTP